MAATFRFEGARQLDAALRELTSVATQKNVARRALRKAAAPILEKYHAGTDVVSGVLLDSEIIGTRLTPRQAKIRRRLGKDGVEIYIGTADPAGGFEEFGSVHNAPNFALTRAYDAEGGQSAVDRIGDELKTQIEKAAARARAKALR